MAYYQNYEKPETKRNRIQENGVTEDIYDPMDNATVSMGNDYAKTSFLRNIKKYQDFVSWARWHPDLLLDLIKPESGDIKLHFDQRVYLRAIMRFQSVYGVFPRGWGKCVSGDTMIFTDKGVMPIKKLFKCEENGVDDYTEKLDLNIINKKRQPEAVDRGTYNGFKDTKKIRVRFGYNVECSLNHPLMAIINGERKWVMAKDLKLGDKLLLVSGYNIWGNSKKMPEVNEFKVCRGNKNGIKFPRLLTKKLARLFGYIYGGCSLFNARLSLSNEDNAVINDFIGLVNRCFKSQKQFVLYKDPDGKGYSLTSTYIVRYLKEIGFKPRGERTIPDFILSAPREMVIEFLKGFVSSKGFFHETNFSIRIVNNTMKEQIRMLLLNLGIVSHEMTETRNYGLDITRIETNKLYSIVGFSSHKLLIEYKKVGILDNEINNEVIELEKEYRQEGYYELESEIIKIEDSKAHVYDVSMPETHSFVSNGFISHNTWGEVISLFLTAILYPRNNFVVNGTNQRKCGSFT